MLWERS